MQEVRERLESLIRDGKITVAEVVRLSGKSRATVDRFLERDGDPAISTVNAIEDVLNKMAGTVHDPHTAERLEQIAGEILQVARKLRGTDSPGRVAIEVSSETYELLKAGAAEAQTPLTIEKFIDAYAQEVRDLVNLRGATELREKRESRQAPLGRKPRLGPRAPAKSEVS